MAGNKFFKWIKRVFVRDAFFEVEKYEKDTSLKFDKRTAHQPKITYGG